MYIRPWSSNPTWFERWIIKKFHQIYYDSGPAGKPWRHTFWFGHRLLKCPLDLWIYQEILYELRPDYIIETGTLLGGSAMYMAALCDMLGTGKIISIDIEPQPNLPQHPRVTYKTASSIDPKVVEQVKAEIAGAKTVLVILDSDHVRDHVLAELRIWGDVVSVGSYCIVEDSNVNGHPVFKKYGPGPMEAMDIFLKEDKRFAVDKTKEKFLLTMNPRGYLKRLS
jgi:cephalosporin hydroxylase